MAVVMKYAGPEGIRKRYFQEFNEIRARIAASGDASLFEDMEDRRPNPILRPGRHSFYYRDIGTISYDVEQGLEYDLDEIQPIPVIEGATRHHNLNPDDDLSLRTPLLKVLQRMVASPASENFTEAVNETVFQDYYTIVNRPRCLKGIENALITAPSYGYGATAFFNDVLLLFHNCRMYNGPASRDSKLADYLESSMKQWIEEMIPNGEQLLVGRIVHLLQPFLDFNANEPRLQVQYDAIVEQGPETWPDPRRILSHPDYYGVKPGDTIDTLQRENFERGQERVRHLRSRLARQDPGAGQGEPEVAIEGEAQPEGQSRKRPREDSEDASDEGESRGQKRQRSLRSDSAGPSTSNAIPPAAAAAKRPRAAAEDDGADEDADAYEGRAPRAAKRQRLMNAGSSLSVPGTGFRAATPGPSAAAPRQAAAAPRRAARKRPKPAAGDDGEGDDQEPGGSPGPAAAKRRRGMKDPPPPARLPAASPEAGPSTPRRPPHEPAVPGTVSSHATSLAGQFTPEPVSFPSHYKIPSSESLKFSRQTIEMGKIVKMGKKRPWLFGYNTPKGGYGIFAFVKCRGRDCKHHFSSHPLENGRAYDHFLSCDQPIRDTRYMVKEYACQGKLSGTVL